MRPSAPAPSPYARGSGGTRPRRCPRRHGPHRPGSRPRRGRRDPLRRTRRRLALIRYESDILIKAPLRTVWKLQTDVERRPSWQPPVTSVQRLIDEGVHLWTFRKVRGGVRVHTEETWTGDQVEADVPTATEALGQGLEAWLRDLKATAEARSGGRPH